MCECVGQRACVCNGSAHLNLKVTSVGRAGCVVVETGARLIW